jgi:VanZ family protein
VDRLAARVKLNAVSEGARLSARRLRLQFPVIVLVVAFTAIPLEVRPLSRESLAGALDIYLNLGDAVSNVAGYLPVGIVLASQGTWAAVGGATALSLFAEVSQLLSRGRSPSVIDVATNILGAVIGLVVSTRWRTRWRVAPPQVGIDKRRAWLAAALASAYVGGGALVTPRAVEAAMTRLAAASSVAWFRVNTRGATAPGRLEARWTFDQDENGIVRDTSENGLNGVLVNGPAVVAGIEGRALGLNGVNQYADFGDPVALRLAGDMTISAWINATSFPIDDAAIVSDHSGLGYQLDTTVDQGERTIGFKLANVSGQLMARYGTTPLNTGKWYHVAGVYDAAARTLDVYLNGRLDNGCLLGTVTSRQRISGVNLRVGRRGGREGFEFAGSIDDVRIYSRALTQSELQAEMGVGDGVLERHGSDVVCPSSEAADAKVIGLIVAFGLLAGIACAGFWPTAAYHLPCLIVSFASGFLLYSTGVSGLHLDERWLIPAFTLVGGLTAAVSITADRFGSEVRRAWWRDERTRSCARER